jgi:hypothetical protein
MRPNPARNGQVCLAIKIPENSPIPQNSVIIISNARFQFSITTQITPTQDPYATSRIFLNLVENGDIIPVVTKNYLVKVFINGKIAIDGLDYTYNAPDLNDRMLTTPIVFKRMISMNDTIEVVCTGIENINITKKWEQYEELPVTNKYGFIFFPYLSYPFSMDYFDLYCNNKKLKKEDVIVYSDRLIRLKNVMAPLKNVVLFTRVKLNSSVLKPFTDIMVRNPNAFDKYITSFCKDYIFEPIDEDFNADESWKDGLDESFKTMNPEVEALPPDPNPVPKYPIIDPLINRLAIDYNADKNLVTKYFNSNVLKPFFDNEYGVLLNCAELINDEILFDSQSRETLTEDFLFNPNKYYRTSEQIHKLLKGLVVYERDGIFDSNSDMLAYIDPILKTYLYPVDVLPLDCNRNFDENTIDENIVLDSNIVEDGSGNDEENDLDSEDSLNDENRVYNDEEDEVNEFENAILTINQNAENPPLGLTPNY